jgi:hypothetical protein
MKNARQRNGDMKEKVTETIDHVSNIIYRLESTFGGNSNTEQTSHEQKSFLIGEIKSELEFIKAKLEEITGKR